MAWVAVDYIGEWIFNCKPDVLLSAREKVTKIGYALPLMAQVD